MSETPIQKRLQETRAARAALGNVREPVVTDEEQLASEERALADDKALADAIAKHGQIGKGVALVETPDGMIVVKRPNPILFRRFQDTSKGEAPTLDEVEKLVRPCVVHPSIASFESILDAQPGVLVRCGNAVCALAGVAQGEVRGKY